MLFFFFHEIVNQMIFLFPFSTPKRPRYNIRLNSNQITATKISASRKSVTEAHQPYCFLKNFAFQLSYGFIHTVPFWPNTISITCGIVLRKTGFRNGGVFPCIKQCNLVLEYYWGVQLNLVTALPIFNIIFIIKREAKLFSFRSINKS